MLPDRVSNPGPLTYESGTLPIVLRGPAITPFPAAWKSDFWAQKDAPIDLYNMMRKM